MTQKQYIYTAEITVTVVVDSAHPMDSVDLTRAVVVELSTPQDDDVILTPRNTACTEIQLQGVRTTFKRDEA